MVVEHVIGYDCGQNWSLDRVIKKEDEIEFLDKCVNFNGEYN